MRKKTHTSNVKKKKKNESESQWILSRHHLATRRSGHKSESPLADATDPTPDSSSEGGKSCVAGKVTSQGVIWVAGRKVENPSSSARGRTPRACPPLPSLPRDRTPSSRMDLPASTPSVF
ncbi:hypothetical protein NPIL_303631 [Nephila pilipes]|uniref:Uncharacterized protein n=1 Tax=Nephila pilipes TaxID=299642 RepID=A0A8X6QPJ1_NEPPI|nr:hypothetical protein NPIL_303631 [Nephila pilipes]